MSTGRADDEHNHQDDDVCRWSRFVAVSMLSAYCGGVVKECCDMSVYLSVCSMLLAHQRCMVTMEHYISMYLSICVCLWLCISLSVSLYLYVFLCVCVSVWLSVCVCVVPVSSVIRLLVDPDNMVNTLSAVAGSSLKRTSFLEVSSCILHHTRIILQ